jgi:transcriptional regulator with XRE-family HTH domain
MSQCELARRLGIHRSQINKWLSGRLRPTVEQLGQAVEVLEADSPMALGYRIEHRPTVVTD